MIHFSEEAYFYFMEIAFTGSESNSISAKYNVFYSDSIPALSVKVIVNGSSLLTEIEIIYTTDIYLQ